MIGLYIEEMLLNESMENNRWQKHIDYGVSREFAQGCCFFHDGGGV